MAKGLQFKGSAVVVNKLIGVAVPPTAVAGTGAGGTPTITMAGGSVAGTITLTTTGTGATTATVLTLTHATGVFDQVPFVQIEAGNAATAALGAGSVFVDAASSTTAVFVIKSGATALPAGTYVWFYNVIG